MVTRGFAKTQQIFHSQTGKSTIDNMHLLLFLGLSQVRKFNKDLALLYYRAGRNLKKISICQKACQQLIMGSGHAIIFVVSLGFMKTQVINSTNICAILKLEMEEIQENSKGTGTLQKNSMNVCEQYVVSSKDCPWLKFKGCGQGFL